MWIRPAIHVPHRGPLTLGGGGENDDDIGGLNDSDWNDIAGIADVTGDEHSDDNTTPGAATPSTVGNTTPGAATPSTVGNTTPGAATPSTDDNTSPGPDSPSTGESDTDDNGYEDFLHPVSPTDVARSRRLARKNRRRQQRGQQRAQRHGQRMDRDARNRRTINSSYVGEASHVDDKGFYNKVNSLDGNMHRCGLRTARRYNNKQRIDEDRLIPTDDRMGNDVGMKREDYKLYLRKLRGGVGCVHLALPNKYGQLRPGM